MVAFAITPTEYSLLNVLVRVQSQTGDAYPNLPVYAFDGAVYTGFHGTTDANGQATFTLPQGSYRFRADYDGVQFWSAQTNECTLPGCASATVTLPGGTAETTTIYYTYDPLYRLTNANYSTGDFYQYAYDSVGNRLTQESMVKGLTSNVEYQYDIANRLADVDGVSYNYDANGNLLNDGVNAYAYDSANRLKTVSSGQSPVTSYQYSGLGDRLSQTVNGVSTNYTLDLNAGLTQVLSDGTNTYTYGLGRISQQSGNTPEYFLGDALGSVRQMTDQAGAVTFAQSYDPYGAVTQTSGAGQSAYGFTGEMQSGDLVYLRARYLNVNDGRFMSRDSFGGIDTDPFTFNRWAYAHNNPVLLTDGSGHCDIICMIAIMIALGLITQGCSSQPDIIPEPDATVVHSIVELNIDGHPVVGFGVALGTVVNNKHTVVTAKHNIPLNTSSEASVTIFPLGEPLDPNSAVKYQLSQLKLKYENSTDMVTLTLPGDIRGNIVPAIPATNYSFTKGDYLTITSQPRDSTWNVGIAIARVNLTGVNPTTLSTGDPALVATADDLTSFSRGGDSGGGVFYNGLYVGLFTGMAEWSPGQHVAYITPYKLK